MLGPIVLFVHAGQAIFSQDTPLSKAEECMLVKHRGCSLLFLPAAATICAAAFNPWSFAQSLEWLTLFTPSGEPSRGAAEVYAGP